MKQYDVAIVGAGVIGASIARVLSRHALKIALIDARGDVSMGASRANSAMRDTIASLVPIWPG